MRQDRRKAPLDVRRHYTGTKVATHLSGRKQKRAGEIESCKSSHFIAELPQDGVRLSGMPSGDPTIAEKPGGVALVNIRAMLGK